MTLPTIGSNVSVSLGDQQVKVKVTAQNQKMLADGDLTNDLGKIKAADGDATTLTPEDFKKAGFDVADSKFLFNVASGVKAFAYTPGNLKGKDATNLATFLKGTPNILNQLPGQQPSTTNLQNYLSNLPITSRNSVLAEMANGTAMMHVRDDLLADLDTKPTGAIYTFKQIIGQLASKTGSPADNVKLALKYMGGDTPENRTLLANKIASHPDMSLGGKHALLNRLGFTDVAANNATIDAAVKPQQAKVTAIATQHYQALGGTGDMPETLAMASGDGTGTKGLAGVTDMAIGLMHYNAATTANVAKPGQDIAYSTVGGITQSTKTFTPQDATKPVSFHLSAAGADQDGTSKLSIGHGGQTYTFNINKDANGRTVISKAANLPANVYFDDKSNTITFPPTAKPFTLTQSSTSIQHQGTANYDEIFTAVGVTNASSNSANLNMNLNDVFGSDRFGIAFTSLKPEQQQGIDALATWLIANPDKQLTVNAKGQGPVWFDGSRPAEMGTYGATDDGTSKPQLLNLRSTMLTSDINAGTLTISATTDPVKSNLGTVGKSALSPKGMEAFNAFKDSHPGLEGNDVLSGMRAFATLEMVQDRLKAKGAKQQILTPDTKVELAQGQVMTYADYLAMKK